MGHNEKDWGGEGNALEMLQNSVLQCWLFGKFLNSLKYPKGKFSHVILLLEVYIFPVSVEITFCALHRLTQRKVNK